MIEVVRIAQSGKSWSRRGAPAAERFWRHVLKHKGDACWEWQASTYVTGYGMFGISPGKIIRAHRYAWEQAYGPIPAGLVLCHRCDNRLCVRPDHLFLGTRDDNNKDMAAKKRTMRREGHMFAKINQEIAEEIRAMKASTSLSNIAVGKFFNVSQATVSRVVNRARFGGWA